MDDSERRNRAAHAYCTSDEYEDAVGPIAIVCHVAGQHQGESYERTRLREALRTLESDSHQFGTRGCKTCRGLSKALGSSFGCVALAEEEVTKR